MNKTETRQLLQDIVEILRDADAPPEIWPAAFSQLWTELRPEGASGHMETNRGSTASRNGHDPFTNLASRVGVDANVLTDLYALEEGVLAVRVPARQLTTSKAAGAIELALLVCAGHEASGQDGTPSEAIRVVCAHYGKFDSSNFAYTLKNADANWQISGSGQKRIYKLRMPGWENTGQVIRRIADIA